MDYDQLITELRQLMQQALSMHDSPEILLSGLAALDQPCEPPEHAVDAPKMILIIGEAHHLPAFDSDKYHVIEISHQDISHEYCERLLKDIMPQRLNFDCFEMLSEDALDDILSDSPSTLQIRLPRRCHPYIHRKPSDTEKDRPP